MTQIEADEIQEIGPQMTQMDTDGKHVKNLKKLNFSQFLSAFLCVICGSFSPSFSLF
jgi:hypothetical protein